MALHITNNHGVDITRDRSYFQMTVEQRVEFLTDAQKMIESLLEAEIDVLTDQLVVEQDT